MSINTACRDAVGRQEMTDEELSDALIPVAVEMMQELGWITSDQFDHTVQTLRDRRRAKLQRLKSSGVGKR